LVVAFAVLTIAGTPFGLLGDATPASVALRFTQAHLFFGACFVLVVGFRGTVWTRPLGWRFLQLSGALSYCLYLVHHSVGEGYEYLLKHWGILMVSYVGASCAVMMRAVAMLGVSFGIALLSRKYLEEPFLSLKDRFTEAEAIKPRDESLSRGQGGLDSPPLPDDDGIGFSAKQRIDGRGDRLAKALEP
jgi:peptidoglycan/LPS O-acetylase OafA/YrhL